MTDAEVLEVQIRLVYYALGIMAMLLAGGFFVIQWRLRGMFVTREELREAITAVVERCERERASDQEAADQRWEDHLRWGRDMTEAITRQMVALEKIASDLQEETRYLRRREGA